MGKILGILFSCFIISARALSQTLPEEGRVLHYRIIGFSFASEAGETGVNKIEIATGNYNTEDSFSKHVIQTVTCNEKKAIVEVPSFGAQYTWRVVTAGSAKFNEGNRFHHFNTALAPQVDTSNIRFRIIKPAEKVKGAYVFLDGNTAIYDMQGKPVWYLPTKNKEFGSNIRDIKPTPFGTITFMDADKIYEVNYNGDILWSGPDDGKVSGQEHETYHHEFTRLTNGHYMVLGNQFLSCTWGRNGAHILSDAELRNSDPFNTTPMQFGTIIEYDENGKVVWSWKTSDYFVKSDLVNYKPANGARVLDLHENAFYFDEREKAIYLSYKNISRIIKIKYPEGTVLSTYGEKYKSGTPENGNGLFCGQHACKYSQIGCLFLFNNNGCARGNAPRVKIFKTPAHDGGVLKKIWDYECIVDENYQKEDMVGGNVLELPDSNVFVCMGGTYSKIFIVNRDKKELWSGVSEKWNEEERKWNIVVNYRASIIYNRKQLERMIWYSGRDTDGAKKGIKAKKRS